MKYDEKNIEYNDRFKNYVKSDKICLQDFNIIDILGEGSSGIVYKA